MRTNIIWFYSSCHKSTDLHCTNLRRSPMVTLNLQHVSLRFAKKWLENITTHCKLAFQTSPCPVLAVNRSKASISWRNIDGTRQRQTVLVMNNYQCQSRGMVNTFAPNASRTVLWLLNLRLSTTVTFYWKKKRQRQPTLNFWSFHLVFNWSSTLYYWKYNGEIDKPIGVNRLLHVDDVRCAWNLNLDSSKSWFCWIFIRALSLLTWHWVGPTKK